MSNPASEKAPEKAERSFEDCFEEIEHIVEQLERGEKPLDESLSLYEKAIAALKRCHGILDKAEKRILLLKSVGAQPTLQEVEVQSDPQAGRMPVLPRESAPRAPEKAIPKKSAQQPVDEAGEGGQNTPPSVTSKVRPNHVKDTGGGSLFGGAQ